MNSDPRVARLLLRWKQSRRQGRPLSLDELCADSPDLRDAVARELEEVASMEACLAEADDDDPMPTALSTREPLASKPKRTDGAPPRDPFGTSGGQTARTASDNLIPPTAPAPAAGDRVIRGYRLLKMLGGGTFGVVYEALSSGGVAVAVKEIRYSMGHPQARRELDALELIKGLRHPYLLALHDFWAENDRLYMAMELADSTLAQRAAEFGDQGYPQAELLQIMEEVAETLDFLHQHRVLHRDVKPANILLLRGHAKVADLGLAKFNPDEVAVTQHAAGTPGFMAPETFRNEFRAESDQYALALCYAELRLGRRVCEGTNIASVVAWHLHAAPKLEGLPRTEEKAVRRALSKRPEDRFRSCGDFVRALRAPKPAAVRGVNWWAVLALLLTIPVIGLVVWRFVPSDKPPPPPPPPPAVDWEPKDHGFVTPEGAVVEQAPFDKRSYYNRVVKDVGGQDVTFLLVPREKQGEQTFYVMENKVSNGLFKAAAKDPNFQKQLAELHAKYPNLKWDEWRKGWRKGNQDVGSDDDALPVLRVNVLEAYCFARWLGGDLPTVDQWDKASGKGSGAKAIILDPDQPLQPGDVAVGRRAEGPMRVGTAKRDVSPVIHCRDMAGNGKEWTRTPNAGGPFPPPPPGNGVLITVLGQSYSAAQPFDYNTDLDYRQFQQGDPAVGFRVVVEP
jgi:serine/threonine protein kinase